MAIEGLALPSNNDSLALHLYNLQPNTTYKIKLDASKFNSNGLQAFIKDAVLKNTSLISNDSTTLSFTTTNDTAAYSYRYSIVFKGSVLPLNSIYAIATLDGSVATVKWNISGKSDAVSYSIQHSTNAKDFTDLDIQKSETFINYSFTDNNAVKGNNYYRIKSIDKVGIITYSNVVCVTIGNFKNIVVFPNPLVGRNLNVTMNNIPTGKYEIRIINLLGQEVDSKIVNHNIGQAENILLNKNLVAATYTIEVIGDNKIAGSSKFEVK